MAPCSRQSSEKMWWGEADLEPLVTSPLDYLVVVEKVHSALGEATKQDKLLKKTLVKK